MRLFFSRLISTILLVWALGFLWFAIALPQPLDGTNTDAIIVPTGGPGRIARGLEMLAADQAPAMLVSGVDREVTPAEFSAEFDVPMRWMDCCITLGYAALDTRGNAAETAQWVEERDAKKLRLVTTDWHMRRVRNELRDVLPDDVELVEDAVRSEPSFYNLFLEYHKLIASQFIHSWSRKSLDFT